MPEQLSSPHIMLGFDFGMKRIGVAVGQTITRSAQPLTILSAQDGIPDWDQIGRLIDGWDANALVVGIPLNMDGSKQNTTFAAQKFANRLQDRFQLPTYTADERLTSIAAQEIINRNRPQKIPRYDAVAAKIILEQWLQGS